MIGCLKRNRFPPSLFKKLMSQQNLENVKAVQWGKLHESDGFADLEVTIKKTVQKTGIWLTQSGILGASPDGLVGDNAVVEIKCRYKSRESSLTEDLAADKSYVVMYNKESGFWEINETHDYYHQIQGQIHLTNRTSCHLVVWTPRESIILEVQRQESWSHWLTAIEKFYFEKFVPLLKENV